MLKSRSLSLRSKSLRSKSLQSKPLQSKPLQSKSLQAKPRHTLGPSAPFPIHRLPRQTLRAKQEGITAISVMAALVIFGFFVAVGLSVAPVYMENFNITSHLSRMQEEPSIAKMSEDDIIETLFKRLQIDDVKNVKMEDVSIVRDKESTDISVSYVAYTPFMGNIEIVISFDEKVTIEH